MICDHGAMFMMSDNDESDLQREFCSRPAGHWPGPRDQALKQCTCMDGDCVRKTELESLGFTACH